MTIKLSLNLSLNPYINNLFRKKPSLSFTNDRMNAAYAAHPHTLNREKARKKTTANSWSQQKEENKPSAISFVYIFGASHLFKQYTFSFFRFPLHFFRGFV